MVIFLHGTTKKRLNRNVVFFRSWRMRLNLKSEISGYVYSLVFAKQNVKRKNVVPILFNLQKNHNIPIAPFEISSHGEIQSEIIDLVINDLVSMKYFAQKNERLSASDASQELFSEHIQKLPSVTPICETLTSKYNSQAFSIEVGKSKFHIKLQASSTTREFVKVLPTIPELGAIFSIPTSPRRFRNSIPLYWERNSLETVYALASSGKLDLKMNDHKKNLKSVRSYVRQILGEKVFDLDTLIGALKILLLSLLPKSSFTIEYICKNGHSVDLKPYDEYIAAFLTNPSGKCDTCYSNIDRLIFLVNNEKIFDDWKNGALMEWFASELLGSSGFNNVFWNLEINNVQCDALAFNEDQVVIVECKRTLDYGTTYEDGLKKLRQLRELLTPSLLKIKTVIMTTIEDEPRDEENINAVITNRNFHEYSKDCSLFLQT